MLQFTVKNLKCNSNIVKVKWNGMISRKRNKNSVEKLVCEGFALFHPHWFWFWFVGTESGDLCPLKRKKKAIETNVIETDLKTNLSLQLTLVLKITYFKIGFDYLKLISWSQSNANL